MDFEDVLVFFNRIGVRIVNDHVMSVVQTLPSRLTMLTENAFIVEGSMCMYGKYMRDINISGFFVQIDAVIRFRKSDHKPFTGDLLVAVDRYARVYDAQEAIKKMVSRKDHKVHDLESLEFDNKLTEDPVGRVFDIGTN